MKFDPSWAWPHPVLRPPEYGDDYPNAEFQVDVNCERTKGGVAARVVADFELSEPDLLTLVDNQSAVYVLLVKSPRTHFRREYILSEPKLDEKFTGELSGRVEFSSFLVCVKKLEGFTSKGWHPDFSGLKFDLMPGAVLAVDKPKEYWVDAADEAPIGAIFEHQKIQRKDGQWECNLDNNRVQICLSEKDSDRFTSTRKRVENSSDLYYLMNGLYLPVLIYVLNLADKHPDVYEEYRWYSSLNSRLEEVGCKLIGEKNSDRASDAQRVLESPFGYMPILSEEG